MDFYFSFTCCNPILFFLGNIANLIIDYKNSFPSKSNILVPSLILYLKIANFAFSSKFVLKGGCDQSSITAYLAKTMEEIYSWKTWFWTHIIQIITNIRKWKVVIRSFVPDMSCPHPFFILWNPLKIPMKSH